MSTDRSLKTKGSLVRHRNVLTRAERIARLEQEDRWSQGDSLLGLPKVAHRKSHAGKKKAEAAAKPAEEAAVLQPEDTAKAGVKPAAGAAKPAGAKSASGKPTAAKPTK